MRRRWAGPPDPGDYAVVDGVIWQQSDDGATWEKQTRAGEAVPSGKFPPKGTPYVEWFAAPGVPTGVSHAPKPRLSHPVYPPLAGALAGGVMSALVKIMESVL